MAFARIVSGGTPSLLRALTWAAVALAAFLFADPGTSPTGHAGTECYLLTKNVGSGSGSITAMPSSAGSCPTDHYSSGYMPALLAEPAPGYVFSSWSGTDNNGANPTTVTMIGDRKVTAYFAWNCYALTMNVGSGSGSVSASPTSAGGCPANQYPLGYTVTVLATSSPGYVFSSWFGTDNNGVNPTTVTMIGDRKVTAYFASNCYTLTTNVGTGSGSVNTSPTSAGGCPANQYPLDYAVTVLANSAPGYVFSSWNGTDNNGVNPTTVTMVGARKVTANFAWNCYTLTTNVGTGSGSVSAVPTSAGGCPANQYPQGYGVSLLANSAPGYAFSSWSGTDNNSVNPTTVTMNGDRKVTANFAWNCYTLTRNVGSGSGSINRTPTSSGGCPTDQYWPGTQVTLMAKPAPGSSFINWSGTDNNGANPSWVMMTGNRKVTAFFTEPPGPTNTPLPTSTSTPIPTSTPTPTSTVTPTNTPTSTGTSTPASSPTPTTTPTPANTATATNTPTSTGTSTPASSPTSTSTPTPANTATPTGTPATAPCPDFEGDTLCDADDPDDDNDGCTDVAEQGDDPQVGGQRDPHNFWDFFDVPTGAGLTRNGDVTGQDIFAVIARFNATDDGFGDFDRNSDPLSTPNQAVSGADRENYHPAYDRGPLVGPDAWDLGPANGSITGQEIFAVLAQFGHSCS